MFSFKSPAQKTAARKAFLHWLAQNHPRLSSEVMRDSTGFGPELAALAADYSAPSPNQNQTDDSWWRSLSKGITDLAPSVIAAKSQYDLMKLNLRRADQGLAPIDSASVAPTVRVQGEIAPQDKRDFMGLGLAAAGIIGAALFFGARKK